MNHALGYQNRTNQVKIFNLSTHLPDPRTVKFTS